MNLEILGKLLLNLIIHWIVIYPNKILTNPPPVDSLEDVIPKRRAGGLRFFSSGLISKDL